jgi:hypothetical protein
MRYHKNKAEVGEVAMANSWTIEITQIREGEVGFRLALPGNDIGQPLSASNGDDVVWYNKTDKTLTLVSISPPNTYLTNPIPAGEPSDPIYQVKGSVTYRCVDPPQQQHSIEVPAPPVA